MLVTHIHPVLRLELCIFVHPKWHMTMWHNTIFNLFLCLVPAIPSPKFCFWSHISFHISYLSASVNNLYSLLSKVKKSSLEILQKVAMSYIESSCYSEADSNISVRVSPRPWCIMQFYSHVTRNAAGIGPGAVESGPFLGAFCKIVRRVS